MSLKNRFWTSHLTMIAISIVLSIITAQFIVMNYTNFSDIRLRERFIERIIDRNSKIIRSLALDNFESLKDSEYLIQLDNILDAMNTGIIIRKDNNIVYVSEFFKKVDAISMLPEFEEFPQEEYKTIQVGSHLLVKQEDFYFDDKTEGSIFFVIDLTYFEQVKNSFTNFVFLSIAIFLIILIVVNTIFTYLMSKKVVVPLNSLKNAANQIKNGDLDFQVICNSPNEIGDLAKSFEEMRIKLKSSEQLKLLYENNRKELITNISHDLKTPITTIKGYVEGIRDGIPNSPEKMDKYLQIIYNNAVELDGLIDDLFLFSKLDLKKLPFSFEAININDYLKDCFEELQFDLGEKGIALTYSTNYNEKNLIYVDRERLKRAILNIIRNAINCMDKNNPVINIILSENEKEAVIEIHDNGCGISSKSLPYIFDRFYRVNPARTTSNGGSGLGLSIAKHIILEHGGRIWAKSKKGEGTSIFFTLNIINNKIISETRSKNNEKNINP